MYEAFADRLDAIWFLDGVYRDGGTGTCQFIRDTQLWVVHYHIAATWEE